MHQNAQEHKLPICEGVNAALMCPKYTNEVNGSPHIMYVNPNDSCGDKKSGETTRIKRK